MPDVLRIATAVDVNGIRAGMAESSAAVKANVDQMIAAFEALKAQYVSLRAEMDALKAKHKSMPGEAREAKEAIKGLGEEIGIHMPRFVASYLTSIGPVAEIAASAFSVIAIVGFVEILGKIPDAIKSGINALRGWDEEAKTKFNEEIALSYKLQAAYDSQYEEWVKLSSVGKTGPAKVAADMAANEKLIAQTRSDLAAAEEKLSGLESLKKETEIGGFWKGLGIAIRAASGDMSANVEITKIGLGEENDKVVEQIKLLKERLSTLKLKPVEQGTESLKLGAEMPEAQRKYAKDAAEAKAEVTKKYEDASIANAEKYVNEHAALGKRSYAEELADFKRIADQKLAVEVANLEAQKAINLKYAQSGENVAAQNAKLDADIFAAQKTHESEMDALDVKTAEQKQENIKLNEDIWLSTLKQHRKYYEEEQLGELAILGAHLAKENEAYAITAEGQIAHDKRVYEAKKAQLAEELADRQVNARQELEALRKLEIERHAAETGTATEQVKAAGDDPEKIAHAKNELQTLNDQFNTTMSKIAAAIQAQMVAPFVAGVDKMTSTLFSGFNSWITGHQKFYKAAQEVWHGWVNDALQAIEKVAEHFIAKQIAMTIAHHVAQQQQVVALGAAQAQMAVMRSAQIASNVALANSETGLAATASAAGVAASAGPAAPIAGPAAAAAMVAAMAPFIAMASFDQGGIMPDTGFAMVHQNEMVLPPALSSFVQRAAASASSSSTNNSRDVHYHAARGESPQSIDRNIAALKRAKREGRL